MAGEFLELYWPEADALAQATQPPGAQTPRFMLEMSQYPLVCLLVFLIGGVPDVFEAFIAADSEFTEETCPIAVGAQETFADAESLADFGGGHPISLGEEPHLDM
ncbi:MAG: hypothetical protein HY360_07505 [Verrucomicrobia bacterium]|nr:hypothetical protein [Verrucomicrobiota bacterium]